LPLTKIFLFYRFWEGSWEDGAQIWSSEKGAYNPDKIHKVTFNGEYYKTSAYCQSHPSPQRTPVLFQAGASSAGKIFCARHAEAILSVCNTPAESAVFTKGVRDMAAKEGRDPKDIKFFQGMAPFLGRTLEEAQAKYDIAKEYADWEGGLATISGFTGVDFSKYPLDQPFQFEGKLGENTVHTMVQSVQKAKNTTMTPRQLGAEFALCGFGSKPVGTPEMVADIIEEWINVGDIDAINFLCKSPVFLFHLGWPLSTVIMFVFINKYLSCLKPRILRRYCRALGSSPPRAWYYVERLRCAGRHFP
jgi:alkanesulfonate monooxygenase SsuD/methylene tetrahydromethanopterin reductase-like flavin-dependent oxidoreductase (luciferase family)